jgi:hypothetical protein
MPGYVSGRRVTEYYVQVNRPNPLGRYGGWSNIGSSYETKEQAVSKAKDIRRSNPDWKVRVKAFQTTKGGYTSL